jgi:hypothetical protein
MFQSEKITEQGFQGIYFVWSSFVLAIIYFVWQSTKVREIPSGTVATPLTNYGKFK